MATQHEPLSAPPPLYVDPGVGEVVLSAKPVVVPSPPDRGEDLRVRVSGPARGDNLPVVLFSHGYGSSLDGYGPLTDYWAAHGFVVVQPTYLDSRTVGVDATDARTPKFWRHRVDDAKCTLDTLDDLLGTVPGLAERVDTTSIAAAGHSFGGQTSGILLGLRVGPPAGSGDDLSDPRVSAGVLLATAGSGGDNLSTLAKEHFGFLNPDFSHMATPALVVAGDRDQSILTTRGPEWSEDPYRLSPGATDLLTLFDGEHSLGGIPGYEAAETTDENPARLGVLQQLTWAYLRTALGRDPHAWPAAVAALADAKEPLGRVESKSAPRA